MTISISIAKLNVLSLVFDCICVENSTSEESLCWPVIKFADETNYCTTESLTLI